MKKKAKKGAKPGTKPQTKLEPVASFFNFFSPPEVPEDGADLDEEELAELQDVLERDYEIGCAPSSVRGGAGPSRTIARLMCSNRQPGARSRGGTHGAGSTLPGTV